VGHVGHLLRLSLQRFRLLVFVFAVRPLPAFNRLYAMYLAYLVYGWKLVGSVLAHMKSPSKTSFNDS
jgi:hypothetical protein